ncbi:S80 family phage morphogenetic serine protease [Endozoicomonas sp. ONNA1]|uniref:S80 family phage morphogenetic serine protease n=1 Tax=Endozoicomonas sp. ONNA1 TaxID=2828740 RepID=UPI0021498EC7|nr:S80 family phage morphogenetic serine protease [Endozoicomonas sp. ONNA1]
MNRVSFQCTALAGTNKVGILKPDKNGYYNCILGALDFPNSTGDVYTHSSAKALFQASGSLQRRIKNGQCRGEYGHPVREKGMSRNEWISRILKIHEPNICHHIRDVQIDSDFIRDEHGRKLIAIRGSVKPAGPQGEALRESLKNPDENVAFSIRSLTDDRVVRGRVEKNFRVIVGWDYVNEPGISVSTKYVNPALESLSESFDIFEHDLNQLATSESGISMESGSITPVMVKSELGWIKTQKLNRSIDW